jgi:hypothetical protein
VRPADLAGKRYFTQEEAAEFERTWLERLVGTLPEVDRFAADLSEVWFDGAKVVPDRRTSLIVEPETGLLPSLVPAARDRIVQQDIRRWFGDSVGHWEGDTLVVDTTNVSEKVQYRGSTAHIHVVERLTRTGPSTITYRATVDDPDTWSTPWTVEIPFAATSARLFEYACHEHNYSMEGGVRGARADEKAGKK